MRLYMILIGCKPKGRIIEQHDIFFGVGDSLGELIPHLQAFWPEANGNLHIDAWREVTAVDGYKISVIPRANRNDKEIGLQLFFLNLGGYREQEFEEYHYKVITVARNLAEATKNAKAVSFYKHFGFKDAVSHIDEKYGVDVDDIHNVKDILNTDWKRQFHIEITKSLTDLPLDKLHIGYLVLRKLIHL